MKPYLYSLPPAWQWQELGEVATLINGRAYKDDELLESGPVPVLRVGNFFSNRSWYYSDLQLPEDKYCNKGDLLYAWSASFGPKIWDGEKAIFHYHIWKILTSPLLDKKYLYYLLASESANIKSAGNGIAMMHATKGGMEKRKIPLPPLAEQQKIAVILDAADSLRQKDQQLVERYTALSQSLFLEMFGDPVTNPKRWEIYPWNDILDIKNGKNQKAVEDLNGEYPIYGSGGNVMAYANQFICNENTVIIGRKGNINKPILIKEKFWNVDTAFGLQAKPEKLSYLYLYWFCVFFNFETLNKTVTIPSLTKSDLLRITTPLPPIELQNQFAERIQLIEAQKQQAELSLEKSEALFNSLLQRAFTGELTAKMVA